MLRNDILSMMKVPAKLVQEISFTKEGEIVTYPVGTVVMVDLDNLIMEVEGCHTEVDFHEFKVMYPN